MREALAIVAQEGLPAMWERHARVQKHLWAGLSSMGLEPFVENPDERLLTVNTVKVGCAASWTAQQPPQSMAELCGRRCLRVWTQSRSSTTQ